MDKELQELNEKLLRFAGFEREKVLKHTSFPGDGYLWRWKYPDGCYYVRTPNFTTSLDAQVKWLWPELPIFGLVITFEPSFRGDNKDDYWCCTLSSLISKDEYNSIQPMPALAAARAIEQVIEEVSCQKE